MAMSPLVVGSAQSDAEAQETLVKLPLASNGLLQVEPPLDEEKTPPCSSVATQVVPVQVTSLSAPAPARVWLETVAPPPAAIVRLRTLLLPLTAMHEVVEEQATERRATPPLTLVAVQPPASLTLAALVATRTLPAASTTAQKEDERQWTSFIAPVPIVTADQTIPEGLVE